MKAAARQVRRCGMCGVTWDKRPGAQLVASERVRCPKCGAAHRMGTKPFWVMLAVQAARGVK